MAWTRDHSEPQVAEYLKGFQAGVEGAFLHTQSLYRGYVKWIAARGSSPLTLIDFARACRAACPAAQSRRRRKGKQCRGWSLWPLADRQQFLDNLIE